MASNLSCPLVLAAAALLAAAPLAAKAPAKGDPSGSYERKSPSSGTLTVKQQGNSYRVHIIAGGIPNGAATAADCELEAMGRLTGNHIDGKLVPFESENMSMTAADIAESKARIAVTFNGKTAKVRETGASSAFCGAGSNLDGTYIRSGKP